MPPPTAKLPPGPRARYPGQHLVSFARDRLGFLRSLATYGDIAHIRLGNQHFVILNNPEYTKQILVTDNRNFTKGRGLERAKVLLGEGLLTSEGAFHLRQRRLAQPAFHRERIEGYARVMVEHAARTRDRWIDGAAIDIHQEMTRLTLGIAGKTLFDADVEGESREIGESLTAAFDVFNLALLPFSELMDHLPLPWTLRFKAARRRLDDTIFRIIAERRARLGDRGDLLSMLMAAQDTEGDGGRMTDSQLRDEIMTILLAGYETTANALTWTAYLLSRNPDAEARMHAEVDSALEGQLPGMADVHRLPYTRMVFAESLRLYPPAWVLGYRAIKAFALGDYEIPSRTIVIMSPFITQRDARYFHDPEHFNPVRWTAEAVAERPRFTYFPFGGGPRQCIGEQFAWTEGVLLLAAIGQKWRLRLAPEHTVALDPSFTLRPKGGMPMIAHLRPGRPE
ncbi:MAG: cytochrome P450 [Gemmatimonadaceae bacterium]|nr:cytochrome P450 [Gemmatimonadaceae bacterium]MDQ3520558.1 cytochrome P450 [Gemmatimonadota bacterium]